MSTRQEFFDRAAHLLGEEHVTRDGAEGTYTDPFPIHVDHVRAAGVRPGSVEDVQALLKLATETGVSLWTISRGKNLGYGGPEPRASDSVVLDLGRMNRIIEVDEELCFAIVEPGVTFFDLYEHIRERGLSLWMSMPALGWGSVLGNTMDRGYGMSPLGDHFQAQCGMEIVLPDGDVLRTGMWAKENSRTGPLVKAGYGPMVDGVFTQSNLGVVTKMGIWLMRAPEVYVEGVIAVDTEEGLRDLVEEITDLRQKDIIQNNSQVGNVIRAASIGGNRAQWYTGEGAIPPEVEDDIREKLGVGVWNARFGLYGTRELTEARIRTLEDRFSARPGYTLTMKRFDAGNGSFVTEDDIPPAERTRMAGIPGLQALKLVDWAAPEGGGGHIDIAPILPADGDEVYDFYTTTKKKFADHGFDCYIGFHMYPRHMVHVTMILFDTNDAEQLERARALYEDVLAEASRRGYAPYRSHVDYMDRMAELFDFNDHAMLRFQERLKDALDPAGVLGPGKQGIWPAALRERRAVTG